MKKNVAPTYIGGQAVIEGVMMRGKTVYALAVRTPENGIYLEKTDLKPPANKYPILKLPIIRGMAAFVDSLVLGMKILTKSAEIAGVEEVGDSGEESKFDKFMYDKFGDKAVNIVMGFAVAISIALSIGIFMVLPVLISGFIKSVIKFESIYVLSLLEGIVKMAIFLGYMFLISKMKDIQRVFMYHGAEHKTIACLEHGDELIVENVRKHTRLHKRCGTSFIFLVMIVSIIVFMFLKTDVLLMRVISRVILVPVVAGISYELIRFAGRSESAFAEFFSKPGLLLQKWTTIEPDDAQIEVAIAAMKGVLEVEPQTV
ncbi:MAG: DUF1385 domain-containing protein [Clostridiales bacterium]|jgi:uncharacterized protein YqhQ|nr:DUF1385 domain-containing protein [Clostridiales bacterium]